MELDNDGRCDFTVTVGIDGARSVDRMMLFRSLGNQKFELVDSHLSYMDTEVVLVPYIPVHILGEEMPLVVVPGDGRILRWRKDGKGIASCDASLPAGHPLRVKNMESPALDRFCDAFSRIAEWAENRLPRKNRMPRWE